MEGEFWDHIINMKELMSPRVKHAGIKRAIEFPFPHNKLNESLETELIIVYNRLINLTQQFVQFFASDN